MGKVVWPFWTMVAQINTITPRYVSDHSLQVRPITNLIGAKVALHGLSNAYTRPFGYIVIQVQVDRVQAYDEDQIALVILDLSNFVVQIPVILGTPSISQVGNMMKEAEVDALAMLWVNARVVHLLLVCRMVTVEVGDSLKEEVDTDGYDQLMYTQNIETIEPFSCQWRQEGPTPENVLISWCKPYKLKMVLCHRASLCRTCTLSWGKAARKVRDNTPYLQILRKKTPVARVVAALPVPKPPEEEQLLEGADESHKPHTPRVTIRQRHGKLFDELDLSGQVSWVPELANAAHQLLAEYHDVFSLDPAELGCTHSMEHTIKVMDDTPFKEWFRWIPPLLVEEVQNHLWEMLESGAIRPSKSAWCNAEVLVWKKEGSLQFCINFCHLNTCTKKDSYPLPRIQEVLESLVGAGHFSCLDLKSGFWQIKQKRHQSSIPPSQ